MNKKVLAVAVSSALAAPMAAHAVKYKLSGQINRAAVYANDGDRSDIRFIDNQSSGTRWRLTGSEDIGGGSKVGFNWEWQNSQNSGGAAIGSADFGESETMRKAEVWFSGGWGKLSLGQGDGAGNGTTEVDVSDTWKLSVSVGIGSEILFTKRLGMRIHGRLLPTFLSSGSDIFCDEDRCYSTVKSSALLQWDVALGLVIVI